MLFDLFYDEAAAGGGTQTQAAGGDKPDEKNPGGGTLPKDFATWLKTQAVDVQKLYEADVAGLKSALDKERENREKVEKTEREAQKAKEEAEAQKLKDAQEFQKLAELRQAKVSELEKQVVELEPVRAWAERLEKALTAQLTALKKDLPKHITALLEKLDVVEQLEYLAANQEALNKPGAIGVPGTPNPSGNGKMSDEERRKKAFKARL